MQIKGEYYLFTGEVQVLVLDRVEVRRSSKLTMSTEQITIMLKADLYLMAHVFETHENARDVYVNTSRIHE